MSTHYIGITIGPIYKTLNKAEKTREIWGGSYLFSYLCRNLVKGLKDNGLENNILLPHPDKCAPGPNETLGVGLYPDRIMLSGDEETFATVQEVIRTTKTALVQTILEDIKGYPAYDPYAVLLSGLLTGSSDDVITYLKNYLQVYALHINSEELSSIKDKDGNPLPTVIALNVLLDHAELRSSIATIDPDPIKVFLRGMNHSALRADAIHSNFEHFPSLPEITTTEFCFLLESSTRNEYDRIVKKDYLELVKSEREEAAKRNGKRASVREIPSDTKEEDLLAKLLAIEGVQAHKRTYHKYVAIIHADGDRMGKLIGELKTPEEIRNFSKHLLLFAQKANEIIAGKRFTSGSTDDWGYGGAPIYIGGDDLVFFAPVASRDKHGKYMTVFDLIKQIDEVFDGIFNQKDDQGKFIKYSSIPSDSRPCLTYGVSITYVKHPLKEAYKQSLDLMYAVKNDDYKSRNRIHFKVQKHSGQWFGGVIDKNNTNAWKAIRELLEENRAKDLKGKQAEGFINSISQKLRFYQSAIEARAKAESHNDLQVSMTALFENAFDEDVHDRSEVRDYLNKIRDLLVMMLDNAKNSEGRTLEERIKEAIDTLHGILRFIHFIRDDEYKNENKRKYETPVYS